MQEKKSRRTVTILRVVHLQESDLYDHICACPDRISLDTFLGPGHLDSPRHCGGDLAVPPQPNSLILNGNYPFENWDEVSDQG